MALTFDANYYLTHRADVFQAFVATAGSTGLSWAQFAQQHYNNHGRFEGSNPNAVFNTNEYLAANPDVAAAGVNPFEHYLTHGVYEGRAPSASFPKLGVEFDADAYLAANPDLGENGIDTPEEAYAHFVLHGQFENRPGAPVVDNGNVGNTYTLTTDAGEQITGTAANDTFNAIVGTGATLNNFDSINGGAGDDSLNIIVDGAYSIPASASISNIETIVLDVDAATGGTIDASKFGGSKTIRQVGANTLDVIGLTSQSVEFTDTLANVEYAAGAKAATIILDEIDDAQTLNVDGVDLTSLTISGSVEAAAGVDETLTITTTNEDPATPANDGSNITTVTISLSNAVDLDVSDLVETKKFDASGSAALDVDLSALVNLETATFGSGADEVDAAISDEADTSFDLGAGNDVFTLNGAGDTDNSLTTVTLGAGNDTFAVITALSNISDASEEEFENGLIAITDFNANDDVFDVSALNLTLAGINNTEIGNIRDAGSLFEAIGLAASYIDLGDGENAVVFTYGSDTYLLVDNDNGADFTDGDGLIKLVGVTSNELDAASFVA